MGNLGIGFVKVSECTKVVDLFVQRPLALQVRSTSTGSSNSHCKSLETIKSWFLYILPPPSKSDFGDPSAAKT